MNQLSQEMQIVEEETELNKEQLLVLEETVCSLPQTQELYNSLTGLSDPTMADDLITYEPELLKQCKKIMRTDEWENYLRESAILLEMLANNLQWNGMDLEPSLHDPYWQIPQ